MDKKNTKRVRMVLYKTHDYDLVSYYMSLKDRSLGNARISFYSVVKGLLNQYVNGEPFKAPKIKRFTEKSLPSKITVRFTLDRENDKEVIKLIENLKERQINSFLKSLVRRNLNTDGLICYLVDKDMLNAKTGAKKRTSAKTQKTSNRQTVKKKPVAPVKMGTVLLESDYKPNSIPEPKPEPEPEEAESSFDFFGALGNINH